VLLLSGGLDSTTTGAIAKADGFELFALSVQYGQRHQWELAAAQRVAQHLHVREHRTVAVDLGGMGGSALTADIAVPKGRSAKEMGHGIPVTYVPARNTVLLSLALAFAETHQTGNIFLGVNAIDYSGYPDCRPEYIAAFERLANLATKAGVEGALEFKIHTPLIKMTKADIIRRGTELGVDFSLPHSCYDPDSNGKSCGRCDACLLRRKGFADAGLVDPISYQIKLPRMNAN
jgi:7-cyano-7-deazaguanine synthase